MRRLLIAAAVAAALTACGRGDLRVPAKPVVLWSSGTVEPRFPTPPEAAWEPAYQRLRQADEALRGGRSQWACYSSGRFESVLRFYAAAYRFSPSPSGVKSSRAKEVFDKVRQEVAELGHEVPGGPSPEGTVQSLVIAQRQDLPMVRLESPYLDITSGRLRRGTLISLCWTPKGGS